MASMAMSIPKGQKNTENRTCGSVASHEATWDTGDMGDMHVASRHFWQPYFDAAKPGNDEVCQEK
jgi:hypothetical protein